MRDALPSTVDHLIIGAGFSGVAAGIKLDEAGERDWIIVDKDTGVGGTWYANTYPGAACDVPSQLYSYSFAPNPDWSMSFSPQPEIQAYIERVARDHDVLGRTCLQTEVLDAAWDEGDQRWRVRTSRGEVVARTVICGSGSLSAPKLPDIEGIEEFAGVVFHTAEWDHSVDLTGKRIAVIGTGASAIQIVPKLQLIAGHLDVYQRTAPHVIPRNDRTYTRPEKFAFRHVPGVMKAYRKAIYWGREGYVPAFVWKPSLAAPAKAMAAANIKLGIHDPVLREQVKPTFDIGCKRILISNEWYPALAADNVELVTNPIARITSTGVVTQDGTERPIDVLVVATGFHATEPPIAQVVHGRGGRTLADLWHEHGMQSYKGVTTHGFPNFFQIVGANTVLGHSSMVYMIEAMVGYTVDAIRTMRVNDYASLDVRQSAQDAWNADLQRRMRKTVWNTGGCASWYLDEHGRNTVLWPRTTYAFARRLRHFDVAAYEVS